MNTKGTTVDYKRMEIKNADELGKTNGEVNHTLSEQQFVQPPSPYKTKAVVSELEDSSTYMNGEPL